MLTPIILAGGTNFHLWPLSRKASPKQFLRIAGNQLTMMQATIERLRGLEFNDPIVICNTEHRFLVAEQLRQLNLTNSKIILEPSGKNSALVTALAAIQLVREMGDATMLILSADHLITDINGLHQGVQTALSLAESGKLVTFGIQPRSPEADYSYIEKGEPASDTSFNILRFVEKPDLLTAKSYIDSGNYYWNSGIFMFKASIYLHELGTHHPDIIRACQKAFDSARIDSFFTHVDHDAFSQCRDLPIDFAVMGKTTDANIVPLDVGWSDVDSWSSIWEISAKDCNGNALEGDVLSQDNTGCYLLSQNRLIAAIGLTNLVIVETKDAILIAHKDKVNEINDTVRKMELMNRQEHVSHSEVYRPWGAYESIDNGDRYQVKRISVKPGAKLSVQMHHHRAEHWIVVSGTAKVTNGNKSYLVTENQSTFIPIGKVHSLENPGLLPLELIEVQSGAYLGEDDIIRFEDKYGRT